MNANKTTFLNPGLFNEPRGQGRVITAFPAPAGWYARFRDEDGTFWRAPLSMAVVIAGYFEDGKIHCRVDGLLKDGQYLVSSDSDFMGFELTPKPDAEPATEMADIRQRLNKIISRVLSGRVLEGEWSGIQNLRG